MKYYIVYASCAECRDGFGQPLIETDGPFDSVEEAKAAVFGGEQEWRVHPQGGWYAASGQGDCWLMPVQEFPSMKE